MSERHFPPPWSVEELDACFVVIDSAGQKLAYVYFEGPAVGRDRGSPLEGHSRRHGSPLFRRPPGYPDQPYSARASPR
jgi:hypothetical protein